MKRKKNWWQRDSILGGLTPFINGYYKLVGSSRVFKWAANKYE